MIVVCFKADDDTLSDIEQIKQYYGVNRSEAIRLALRELSDKVEEAIFREIDRALDPERREIRVRVKRNGLKDKVVVFKYRDVEIDI